MGAWCSVTGTSHAIKHRIAWEVAPRGHRDATGISRNFGRPLHGRWRDKSAREHAHWSRLGQSAGLRILSAGLQPRSISFVWLVQTVPIDGGCAQRAACRIPPLRLARVLVKDWPSQTSRLRLGQSPHRPYGGLAACSRGSLCKRNASKIGTVWAATQR